MVKLVQFLVLSIQVSSNLIDKMVCSYVCVYVCYVCMFDTWARPDPWTKLDQTFKGRWPYAVDQIGPKF